MSSNSKGEFIVPVQFISIDSNGTIKSSDQKLLNFQKGAPLKEAHPFFESIDSLFNSSSTHLKLDCVNMFDRTFDVEVITHKDNSGVIILRDRSEFYSRIQEVAQQRNQSLILNELLEIKNDLLQEKEAFKTKFIKNFSQELRSPLTLISAFSSLLLKGELDLEQTKLVEALKEQSDSIRKLLDDVIELSKLKKGNSKLVEEVFSFKDLLANIYLNFNAKVSLSKNTFEMDVASGVPDYLVGDQRRIGQVINNLIENALIFNNGNHIKFEVTENHKRAGKTSLRFQVHHKGIVPEGLGDKYELKDLEKMKPEGLNFSIVRELVELLDGTVKFNKIDKDYTQQIVNLKVAYPLHEVKLPPKKTSTVEQYKFTEKVKVLIADENTTTQFTALKVLVSTGNFNTEVYTDPRELLEAVENREFDLILMSSSISQIDSIELISIIKQFANEENKKIPILALTVHTSKESIAAYKAAGFKDVIKKPYTDDELLNTIYKRLRLKKFL
ncbi:signal transduction histidine kinase [Nonlabens dokdonensis]|uniref:histidine kinase n=2 Tax=Nonlabens dokdonensis TaxID=328515 RepID=L7WAN5_NONDD|nr:hybrid sensor histidine kinase/response regulator [Nonlabens dokdonensis]AGC76921.1 multi-sensor hybrid histidine kinase [Nonlabens dokdonensis DSW-6]PZX36827.1 signal transduction histidine kinase [Nonlabens dokdonensis]